MLRVHLHYTEAARWAAAAVGTPTPPEVQLTSDLVDDLTAAREIGARLDDDGNAVIDAGVYNPRADRWTSVRTGAECEVAVALDVVCADVAAALTQLAVVRAAARVAYAAQQDACMRRAEEIAARHAEAVAAADADVRVITAACDPATPTMTVDAALELRQDVLQRVPYASAPVAAEARDWADRVWAWAVETFLAAHPAADVPVPRALWDAGKGGQPGLAAYQQRYGSPGMQQMRAILRAIPLPADVAGRLHAAPAAGPLGLLPEGEARQIVTDLVLPPGVYTDEAMRYIAANEHDAPEVRPAAWDVEGAPHPPVPRHTAECRNGQEVYYRAQPPSTEGLSAAEWMDLQLLQGLSYVEPLPGEDAAPPAAFHPAVQTAVCRDCGRISARRRVVMRVIVALGGGLTVERTYTRWLAQRPA